MKERLRFVNFVLDRLPSGECRVRVTLAWPDGASFDGEARGLTSQAGELRCAAQAALLALAQADTRTRSLEQTDALRQVKRSGG